MNKLFLILIFFQSKITMAAGYPYNTLDSTYKDTPKSTFEVTSIGPIKAQDGVGLCYGFSSTTLLENYRCRELKLDCNNPNNILSSLDVTSYYDQRRSLKEGGYSNVILSNIQRSSRKIAKEECVKFSTIVQQLGNQKEEKDGEKKGWFFLISKWNEYKGINPELKRNDCVSCLANSIKSTLVNIQTPADQISDAFTNSRTLEEFLYQSILPKECLQEKNILTIPEFETKVYPGYREAYSSTALSKKIESILLSNMPLEMSFCVRQGATCSKGAAHSIALVGIKEACSSVDQDCRLLVKIKNSYGLSWQQQNNDGWVDLNTLVESSHVLGETSNITWIQRPGYKLTEKSLIKNSVTDEKSSSLPINSNSKSLVPPDAFIHYKGTWKCPQNKFSDRYEVGCRPMK